MGCVLLKNVQDCCSVSQQVLITVHEQAGPFLCTLGGVAFCCRKCFLSSCSSITPRKAVAKAKLRRKEAARMARARVVAKTLMPTTALLLQLGLENDYAATSTEAAAEQAFRAVVSMNAVRACTFATPRNA